MAKTKDIQPFLDSLGSIPEHSKRAYANITAELARREMESLTLYDPLPFQKAYHSCTAKECVLMKANRAGGPMPLDTPVLTPEGWVEIGTLQPGDDVIAGDGSITKVIAVHPQGWKSVFKLTFDDGASVHCCHDHPWKCKLKSTEKFKSHKNFKEDKWGVYTLREIRLHGGDNPIPWDKAAIPMCVAQLPKRSLSISPYVLGVILGDGCIAHDTVSITTEDEQITERVCRELPDGVVPYVKHKADNGKAHTLAIPKNESLFRNPVVTSLRSLGLMGTRSQDKSIPRDYMLSCVDDRVALLQGLMDTDGYCDKKGNLYFYTCSRSLATDMVGLVRSLGGKAKISWKETNIVARKKKAGRPSLKKLPGGKFEENHERLECLQMASVHIYLPKSIKPFHLDRKMERRKAYKWSLRGERILEKIEPDGNAECVCITVAHPDHTYVCKDYIVTHNSLAGFAEDARAAMGCDPYGKYPKENGVVACLGYGEKHIGRVIYRYLCQPGAFRIIKDEITRKWRVYRAWSKDEPWNGLPGDEHRYDETREAPPFIPERYIKNIAWERRSDYVFSRMDLINGWVIHAANTAGDPKQFQGFDVHLVHIDEDTATPGWYEEMVGRTAMVKGKLRWTALPHAKNDEMMTLLERAEDESRAGMNGTIVLRATLFDNPYYPKESREQNVRLWKSQGEEMYRKRALGEMVMDSRLMYPSFSPAVHEAIKFESPRLKVQEILTERNGDPPADWCRYLVIDPGHSVCAALFFAVPPPSVGDFVVLYDELYIRECTAVILANAVKQKTQDYCFQEFIIDAHGGRLADIASGIHPMRQYEKEFEKRGIKSVATGHGFRHGSSDINGRVELLRSWMATRADGTTKFLLVTKRCANTGIEFRRFKKKVATVHGVEVPLDEGERRNTHAVECCEYAAAHGLPYIKPKSNAVKVHAVDAIISARKERAAQRAAKSTRAQTNAGFSLGPK